MRHFLDYRLGFLRGSGSSGEIYPSIVFNGYLRAGFFHYFFDSLAAAAYDHADLVRIDLDDKYLWSVRRYLGAGSRNFFFNRIQYGKPGRLGLQERLAQYFYWHSFHLYIELNRGHARARTCDLEIHVAVMVLRPLNVCQNFICIVALIHQSHSNARNGREYRNSAVHKRQAGSADRCLRSRAV